MRIRCVGNQIEIRGSWLIIISFLVGSNDCCFPWKIIWKQKILSLKAFFVWTVALGKYLTIDNLRKMKVWILDWCYMCKCNGELVDHLFLHCPVAMDLWSIVLGLFGVSWVMPESVVGSKLAGKAGLVVIEMVIYG